MYGNERRIIGYPDSYVQTYAQENELRFQDITKELHTLTVIDGFDQNETSTYMLTEGETIELFADDSWDNIGYEFYSWTSSNGGTFDDAQSPYTDFIMPDNDTSVKATIIQ